MENNMYKVKTDALVKLRDKKDYTQEKMGELLHMERSNYGKIERGENTLNLETAFKIANVLGCKIEDFVNLPTTYNHVADSTFTDNAINSLGGTVTVNHHDSPLSEKIVGLLEEAIKLLKGNTGNK